MEDFEYEVAVYEVYKNGTTTKGTKRKRNYRKKVCSLSLPDSHFLVHRYETEGKLHGFKVVVWQESLSPPRDA